MKGKAETLRKTRNPKDYLDANGNKLNIGDSVRLVEGPDAFDGHLGGAEGKIEGFNDDSKFKIAIRWGNNKETAGHHSKYLSKSDVALADGDYDIDEDDSFPEAEEELLDDHDGERVDHPDHYNSHPSGIEAIEVVRHYNFNVGNALKYLWRAGLKDENTEVEDLRKAIWYINDEIMRLEDGS